MENIGVILTEDHRIKYKGFQVAPAGMYHVASQHMLYLTFDRIGRHTHGQFRDR